MSYDILFEPIKIGPVVAPNRFYQVPHCNGLGHVHPRAEAQNRGVKAEGGWGVVCTQEVEIHPSADISPAFEGRLWDDKDIPVHQLLTEKVHEHGSLAGIELCYNGHHAPNMYSRIAPMTVSAMPVHGYHPLQAREMSLRDIKNLRQWHVDAARRAQQAGYDIVYAYAGHDMSTLMHFMLGRYNRRSDEYGGSLTNRVRLTREILEAMKDAVGDRCAIAFRFAVDELKGREGLSADAEAYDVVSMLAELPDLWDVNVSDWSNDSATARFEPAEGYQEKYTRFIKKLTSKPVVGVGRFTSADSMVSQIKRGVLDIIGAARPSIADPFLPSKIRNGDFDAIRECIGCNICVASDNTMSPIRCTQNPTMGEEWKRDWHPEKTDLAESPAPALVVGGGPSGLECALQLSQRGFPVTLAEAGTEFGGRALLESRLPGLASYVRVRDYRLSLLERQANVQLLPANSLTPVDVIDSDFEHVFIATGAKWQRQGRGHQHPDCISTIDEKASILTPDDILAGFEPSGRVIVYDDDHYYMGGVIAEKLVQCGCTVTLVTPDNCVSSWTAHTLEQVKIQTALLKLGVTLVTAHEISSIHIGHCSLGCIYTGKHVDVDSDAVVLVTSRSSCTELFDGLEDTAESANSPLKTVLAIGDCEAPSTIAAAVYSGHLIAREFDRPDSREKGLFRREIIPVTSNS